MLSLLLLVAAADVAAAQPTTTTLIEPNPKVMSQREIKAYNASLPKDHPFYIRCVSTLELGSLVKRNYSCRTNRQWALSDDKGNQNARETYDAMTSKATTTSQ